MSDVEKIAAGLTKAQRSYLIHAGRTGNAVTGDISECLYTYPPSNTHAVLIRLGLVSTAGRVTDAGVAVRAHLISQQDTQP